MKNQIDNPATVDPDHTLPLPLAWEDLPSPQPELICTGTALGPAPSEADCLALWDHYAMPVHIREHSELVAAYAMYLGCALGKQGVKIDLPALYASSLLHDIAKLHCINNGGSHAQVGAAWVVQKTGMPLVAQGVLHHVYWPWKICFKSWPLPLIIQYADKRVKHNQLVNVSNRFEDLFERYGRTERSRKFLTKALEQAQELEQQLTKIYKVDIHAHFTYSRRLVS